MDLKSLQRELIEIARANPPSEGVPYGFEKRVMRSLRGVPRFDAWAFWAGALWRAATPCIGLVLLVAAWSMLNPTPSGVNNGSNSSSIDVAQQFENTVLAAAESEPASEFLQ